jgi:hypothetical protein
MLEINVVDRIQLDQVGSHGRPSGKWYGNFESLRSEEFLDRPRDYQLFTGRRKVLIQFPEEYSG